MHRRFFAPIAALFAFVAVDLVVPDIAQSAPMRAQAERAKQASTDQPARRRAKRTRRHVTHARRSATRRLGQRGAQAQIAVPSDSWVGSSEATRTFVTRPKVRGATRPRVTGDVMTNPDVGMDAYAWAGSDLVVEARRWIGGNPTGRRSLWCARFMNFVLKRAGYQGTGSDMARSFSGYGRRISGPRVGAIAVMARGRRGGHVGVVSGIDADGNPIIISGNHNNRVAEATYPRSRIRAYVMPRS